MVLSRVLSNARNHIVRKYNPFTHRGVDVLKWENKLANVIAHSDGEVIEVVIGKKQDINAKKGKEVYGNFIKIRHGNGYYTLYAHLSEVFVQVGQKVVQGEVLGKMGNSGKTSRVKLHFEVRNKKDRRINPIKYLEDDLPFFSKRSFFYQVYDCTNKGWQPLVKEKEYFAGIFGHPIGGILFQSDIKEVMCFGYKYGEWISMEEENLEEGIQGFQLLSNDANFVYRVHFIDKDWTEWIYTSDCLKDGLKGESFIDAIQICMVEE